MEERLKKIEERCKALGWEVARTHHPLSVGLVAYFISGPDESWLFRFDADAGGFETRAVCGEKEAASAIEALLEYYEKKPE